MSCLFSMLISTVIKDGDVRRYNDYVPGFGYGRIDVVAMFTFNRTKLFVRYIACFYFVLMAINFFFLLVSSLFC